MTAASLIPFPNARRTASSDARLAERVHALAADSFNVRMGEPHFRESMTKRGIDMRSVLEVLRTGRAVGSPELDEYGDWRIERRRRVAGRRVHVVVAVCAGRADASQPGNAAPAAGART